MQTQTTLIPFGEGDRFALVLDRSTLDALAVAPNATFNLEIVDGALVVRPKRSGVNPRLADALEAVNRRHAETLRELGQ